MTGIQRKQRGIAPSGVSVLLVALAVAIPTVTAEPVRPVSCSATEQRHAPPDAAAQDKAVRIIHDLYKAQYALRASTDREALAKSLRKHATEVTDDDTGTFVMLREARDLAAGAGDFMTALGAIDDMNRQFAIEPNELKFTILKQSAHGLTSQEAQRSFVEASLSLGDSAVAAEDYDLALKATSLAEIAARNLHDALVLAGVKARGSEYARLQKEGVRLKAAEDRLAADRADADDYLILGRHRCFTAGDWVRGLPMLAKSSDAALKALALKETSHTLTAAGRRDLADAWWDAAEKAKGRSAVRIRSHAASLYEQALPDLGGLERTLAEQRIAQASEEDLGKPHWISKSAKYAVSSKDNDDRTPLANLLDGTGGGYQNNGFAFSTKNEDNPYIVIDLGAPARLKRLEIVNRRDDLAERAKTLAAWVSASAQGPWTPVWQSPGTTKEWTVELPAPVSARYVKLGLREHNALHLFSVKIYGWEGQ
ncbi:MAG: hypothetical protein JWN24_3627 [Phycisphaerales bacterium]|nr:hypothetical protein [Phycisphaerales bacterium]